MYELSVNKNLLSLMTSQNLIWAFGDIRYLAYQIWKQLIGWEKSVVGSVIMKIECGYGAMGKKANGMWSCGCKTMACDLVDVDAGQWHMIFWSGCKTKACDLADRGKWWPGALSILGDRVTWDCWIYGIVIVVHGCRTLQTLS